MAGLYLLWALIQFLKALWDVHRTEFTRFERFKERIDEEYDDSYGTQWLTIGLSISFLLAFLVTIMLFTHFPYPPFGSDLRDIVIGLSYIAFGGFALMYICA
jgi:hypothetical protein